MTNIKLASIERDKTIQCRAHLSLEVINDYAECMTEGAKLPPIEVFGTKEKCWVGDGWHRLEAAESNDWQEIPANLHPGGRAEALKFALAANIVNGHRRTNDDKRRCVEIALEEYPDLSDRAIADTCGVSGEFVRQQRPQVPTVGTSKSTTSNYRQMRIGKDGKQYPRKRAKPMIVGRESSGKESKKSGSSGGKVPHEGMFYATSAVAYLKQIKQNDAERGQAFEFVRKWLKENE